jgi:hypothetical protein
VLVGTLDHEFYSTELAIRAILKLTIESHTT